MSNDRVEQYSTNMVGQYKKIVGDTSETPEEWVDCIQSESQWRLRSTTAVAVATVVEQMETMA